MLKHVRHPFGQAVAILVVAYLLIEFGIQYIPPLLGISSAPVPTSITVQYMLTVLVGVLLYVSDNEERWRRFKEPIVRTMVKPERKLARVSLMVAIPLLVGFLTYEQVRPKVSAPAALRSIHPAPPTQINFRGEPMRIEGLENPLRGTEEMDQHVAAGEEIYYRDCMPCHGDYLDGGGHYAGAFSPAPLSFQDVGTIAQLTESFVFWRIAKGGPGLPREGAPWLSAMPAWEDLLTEEQIWQVTLFLYEQTGHSPRTWGDH